MHRMAIMAFLVPETIDRDRCIKMALVHDLAEAIVGDITPHCGVSEEDKHSREKNAMANMVSLIDGHIGKEIMELWEEYEQNSTPEAHFVKDIDKFDMILQADEYETSKFSLYHYQTLLAQNKDLSRFFTSTEGIIKTDLFRNMDREVRIQRANRLSGQQ